MPALLRSRFPQIIAAMPVQVGAALRVGAEMVAADAKARVPVRSGKLREAIHTRADEDGIYVVAGNDAVFYGHIVEHGSTNSPAQPFLVPAAEARKDDVAGAVSTALKRL